MTKGSGDNSLGDLADGLSLLPSERRQAIAREICKSDPASLDRLLAAISDSGQRSLETQIRELLGPRADGAIDDDAPTMAAIGPDLVGSRVGGYRITGLLGEGGFGVVYAAEQEHPIRRTVAIKLIKAGMDTRRVVARFEAERQALARMDHPNIARVLDAGTTALGRPYFVMELVEGAPITAYADGARLSVFDRLRLMLPICDAVQHAHHKGVVHRDIKPGNVLVARAGGTGEGFGGVAGPKVIDFGVAKALHWTLSDRTLYTEVRQLIGTPAYMSPEQVTPCGDVDTRVDVYALGVLLYELLVSRPPFDAEALASASVAELERIIRDVDPPRPSVRAGALPGAEKEAAGAARATTGQGLVAAIAGDLDWVVMKAIDKDRSRRYETPAAFAADIRRVLEAMPVQARHPSRVYLVRKFVHRHRGPVIAGCLGGAALIGLLIATASGFASASRARDDLSTALGKSQASERRAGESAAASHRQRYSALMQAAYQMYAAGDGVALATLLERAPEDLRGWEWRYLHAASTEGSSTLSPEGRTALDEHDRVAALAAEPSEIPGMFAGFARGPHSSVVRMRPGADSTRLAREDTRAETILTEPRSSALTAACVSPDGRFIALGFSSGSVKVRRLQWEPGVGEFEQPPTTYFGVRWPLALAWTPDGARIVARDHDSTVREWDVGNGSGQLKLPALRFRSGAATLSGDSARVYTASWCDVTAYDARGGWPLWMRNFPDTVEIAVEVEDGKRLLTFSHARAGPYLLEAATGAVERIWTPGEALADLPGVVRCALRIDDRRLALGLSDGHVAVLNESTWTIERLLGCRQDPGEGVGQLTKLASGQLAALLVCADFTRGRVVLLDSGLESVRPLDGLPPDITGIGAPPAGQTLLAGTADGGVVAWDVAKGLPRWRSRTLRADAVRMFAFPGWGAARPNPRVLAASIGGTLACLDALTGEVVMEQQDVAPNPRMIATGDDAEAVIVSSATIGVLRLEARSSAQTMRSWAGAVRAHWRYMHAGTFRTSRQRARVLDATPDLVEAERRGAARYNEGVGDHIRRLNSDALAALTSPAHEARAREILDVTEGLVELAPDSPSVASTHAWACLNASRVDDAITQSLHSMRLLETQGQAPFAETLLVMVIAHARQGDHASAHAALVRAQQVLEADVRQRDASTAWLLARARAELQRAGPGTPVQQNP